MHHYYPQRSLGSFLKISSICAIIISSLLISNSTLIVENQFIAPAITFDMIVSIPLIYVLLIRKTLIPNATIAPVFLLSLGLAWYFLPTDNRSLLEITIAYILPLLEIFLLIFVALKFYRVRRKFESDLEINGDFYERFRDILKAELPQAIACAVAFEISAAYYAFCKWVNKSKNNTFSYHRTGTLSIGIVLLFLLAVEMVIAHTIIGLWNNTAAWIVTAVGLYFGFQLFAHFKAVMFRPIEIVDDDLFFRCGIIGDVSIKIGEITNCSLADSTPEPASDSIVITPLGAFTKANVSIDLGNRYFLNGIYGMRRPFSSIFIHIDDPDLFIETLTTAKSRSNYEADKSQQK